MLHSTYDLRAVQDKEEQKIQKKDANEIICETNWQKIIDKLCSAHH